MNHEGARRPIDRDLPDFLTQHNPYETEARYISALYDLAAVQPALTSRQFWDEKRLVRNRPTLTIASVILPANDTLRQQSLIPISLLRSLF